MAGAVALPLHVLSGTLSGPPILGTLNGVLSGAVQTVASTTHGVLRLATFALPIAWKAAPLIPLFL